MEATTDRERYNALIDAYRNEYGTTECEYGVSIYRSVHACQDAHFHKSAGGYGGEWYCSFHSELQKLDQANAFDPVGDMLRPSFIGGCLANLIMVAAFLAGFITTVIIVGTATATVLGEWVLDLVDATPLSPGDDPDTASILGRSAILFVVVGSPFCFAAYRAWRHRQERQPRAGRSELWLLTCLFTFSVYVALAIAVFCYGIIATIADNADPNAEVVDVTLNSWVFIILGGSLALTATVHTWQMRRARSAGHPALASG